LLRAGIVPDNSLDVSGLGTRRPHSVTAAVTWALPACPKWLLAVTPRR